jgi:hypothetical protein
VNSPGSVSALSENSAQLQEEIVRENCEFETQSQALKSRIKEIDNELEIARETHRIELAKFQMRITFQSGTIRSLEESANYGISDPLLDESVQLKDQKEQLERHFEQIEDTKSQLLLVLQTIESQNNELRFLMSLFPFENDELKTIALDRLSLPIDREIYELQTENQDICDEMQHLTEEIHLVRTLIEGLRTENERISNRIAKAKEFEGEIGLTLEHLTQPIYRMEGIGQDELNNKVREIRGKLKHELSVMNLKFQKEMDGIGCDPAQLRREIQEREEVTEALNARISDIVAELESNRENGETLIAKQREKNKEEIEDIILRAQRKKDQILRGQIASPLN